MWRIPVPRADGTHEPSRAPALNPRDREVLRQLAAGGSTAQIARALSVSSNTARTRIRRISAKLAVTGRHDVVDTARVLGLV
jgi:DNA-binding CsgD family transcriptional regulator